MSVKTKQVKTILRRVASLLLACLTVLMLAPQASGEALQIERGKVTIYQFDWMNSYEELTDPNLFPEGEWVDVMLAWDDTTSSDSWGNGKVWVAGAATNSKGHGTYKGNNDGYYSGYDDFGYWADESWYIGADSGISIEAESFFTQNDWGHFRIRRVGKDSDGGNESETADGKKDSPTFHFAMLDGNGTHWGFGLQEVSTRDATVWKPNRLWLEQYMDTRQYTAMTFQLFADPAQRDKADYRYGTINIFEPRTMFEFDHYFTHNGNTISMSLIYLAGKDWNRGFRVYTRTVRSFDVFVDDITVNKGVTFRIDEDVMLPDDTTITVKDGGVMVVNSHLILNGKIVVEEGGTVILNEGATVNPYYNETDYAGCVDIRGGNVVMLDGAKLICDSAESYISITEGGSLINNGLVVASHLRLSEAALLRNEAGSTFVIGHNIGDSHASAKGDPISQILKEMSSTGTRSDISITGQSKFINRGKIISRASDDSMYMPVVVTVADAAVGRNEGNGTTEGISGTYTTFSWTDMTILNSVNENFWPE
ncbi:MAG: hypothetical protein IKV99_07110 [Oscillospiraceae bacterium]|nr:hypothetical protein [Oscillospiraceae bacterium]